MISQVFIHTRILVAACQGGKFKCRLCVTDNMCSELPLSVRLPKDIPIAPQFYLNICSLEKLRGSAPVVYRVVSWVGNVDKVGHCQNRKVDRGTTSTSTLANVAKQTEVRVKTPIDLNVLSYLPIHSVLCTRVLRRTSVLN